MHTLNKKVKEYPEFEFKIKRVLEKCESKNKKIAKRTKLEKGIINGISGAKITIIGLC